MRHLGDNVASAVGVEVDGGAGEVGQGEPDRGAGAGAGAGGTQVQQLRDVNVAGDQQSREQPGGELPAVVLSVEQDGVDLMAVGLCDDRVGGSAEVEHGEAVPRAPAPLSVCPSRALLARRARRDAAEIGVTRAAVLFHFTSRRSCSAASSAPTWPPLRPSSPGTSRRRSVTLDVFTPSFRSAQP